MLDAFVVLFVICLFVSVAVSVDSLCDWDLTHTVKINAYKHTTQHNTTQQYHTPSSPPCVSLRCISSAFLNIYLFILTYIYIYIYSARSGFQAIGIHDHQPLPQPATPSPSSEAGHKGDGRGDRGDRGGESWASDDDPRQSCFVSCRTWSP